MTVHKDGRISEGNWLALTVIANGNRHGYLIAKDLVISSGVAYRRLKKLETDGILASNLEFPSGKKRAIRRYTITEAGWEAIEKYGAWVHGRLTEVQNLYSLRARAADQ